MKNKIDLKTFLSKINWHLVFVCLFFLTIGLIVWRILNYGVRIDPDKYESQEYLADISDNIVPFILSEEQKEKDDGITTIVAMGNSPFADDRNSDDNLANIIAREADAVVYNCSVADSYLAAEGSSLTYTPTDAFNFYWLVTSFCRLEGMEEMYQEVFASMGDVFSREDQEIYNSLMSIDFNSVDVIVVMYDASDYLEGHPVFNSHDTTDINSFSGNLAAGIDLIRYIYPHIRIIVMSPTYAYAVDEDGNYKDSETTRYGDSPLSSYMSMEGFAAETRGVTFLDHLYGTIYSGNAQDYLTDNLHLNRKGRELVADRFLYALNYFNPAP